jgi:hypothetical protein
MSYFGQLMLPFRDLGHKIVFEEQSGQFGLATAQNIFIGFWGSFVQTLQALEAVE